MGKFKNLFEEKSDKIRNLRNYAINRNTSIIDFYMQINYKNRQDFNLLQIINGMILHYDAIGAYKLSNIDNAIKDIKEYIKKVENYISEINPDNLGYGNKYEKIKQLYSDQYQYYLKKTGRSFNEFAQEEYNLTKKKLENVNEFLKIVLKIQKTYKQALLYKDEYDE